MFRWWTEGLRCRVLQVLLAGLIAPTAAQGQEAPGGLYFIDAHSQIDKRTDPSVVIQLMNEGGVRRLILSTTGHASQEVVLTLARQFPERIVPAVRTKQYMTQMSVDRFKGMLAEQADSDVYGAMAEVLLYHAAKSMEGGRFEAQEVVVTPDDARVEMALETAIAHHWPFIAHIEFAAAGSRRAEFMTKFETLITRHPEEPFLLIHLGQLNAAEVGRLIAEHPNVYFLTSTATPIAARRGGQPWTNMFKNTSLTGEWKAMLTAHPDRFVLAFDNVVAPNWGPSYLNQIRLWRSALQELPNAAAQMIAHGNAERLWRLPAS
ncbi:MAG TPA: amidohydrolase family protein [Blastocatellia bacterium]|nr:amidohydrolase family protein [Blastocatellia bacterium]